jgi:hypothetical protein
LRRLSNSPIIADAADGLREHLMAIPGLVVVYEQAMFVAIHYDTEGRQIDVSTPASTARKAANRIFRRTTPADCKEVSMRAVHAGLDGQWHCDACDERYHQCRCDPALAKLNREQVTQQAYGRR